MQIYPEPSKMIWFIIQLENLGSNDWLIKHLSQCTGCTYIYRERQYFWGGASNFEDFKPHFSKFIGPELIPGSKMFLHGPIDSDGPPERKVAALHVEHLSLKFETPPQITALDL